MLVCFLESLAGTFLACAGMDDASPLPRVLGLPLPLAILSVILVVPLFWAITAKIGSSIR